MKRDGIIMRQTPSFPSTCLTTNFYIASLGVLVFFVSGSVMLAHTGELRRPALMSSGRSFSLNWLGDNLHDDDGAGQGQKGRRVATNRPFTTLLYAFREWDSQVGCEAFRASLAPQNRSVFLQDPNPVRCSDLKSKHVSVLVKGHSWIPDSLNNLHACDCGLSCLWVKSNMLADDPDAHFYEMYKPPKERQTGEPLRAYIELESHRTPATQDIFVSYHHEDTLQATYAGSSFHMNRNHFISPVKKADILVYWSSSRCVQERQDIAKRFLRLVPHHSFGKCLNNVGGRDAIDGMYVRCHYNDGASWSSNLHCAMSHYKFVLAIENTFTDSYVTEKLFYALDAGSVPIYFGAPNVLELVPPNSIILGSDFKSMEELAKYVKNLANNPVQYAAYHAWRRCGELGNYLHTRAVSLDSLPCRLCATVSKMGGKNAPA